MSFELWTLAIAIVTAVACSLCGVFLVLKREALVCEGLSHAVLPGVIIAYVLFQDRSSPLLILSAAAMGLVMVLLVQGIRRTGLVESDASLGIVFPALFSVGILLASAELKQTHFHADCIVEGNLALAPLDTLTIAGLSLGPKAFCALMVVLVLVALFLIVFAKEVQLMVFDEGLSSAFGFRPGLMHATWLGLVSITTVAAFEAAGSILVVALMITPPAAAYLLTDDLRRMIAWSGLLAVISAVAGFYWSLALDVPPTGPMSSVAGALFLLVLVLAPKRGLAAGWRRRGRQVAELSEGLLLARLSGSRSGLQLGQMAQELQWPQARLQAVLDECRRAGLVEMAGDAFRLSDSGSSHLKVCLPTLVSE